MELCSAKGATEVRPSRGNAREMPKAEGNKGNDERVTERGSERNRT